MSETHLLLPPADHVRLLHPAGRRAIATMAERERGTRWVERPVPIVDLPEYARAMRGATDVFVSQQSFYGWRRIAQLAQLGAVYSDLDYRKTNWAGESAECVRDAVLRHLDESRLPVPTYILSTGRGLLATWLHEGVPRAALPRWMAIQRVIQRALAEFGADPMAVDAARVFRLSGTRHSVANAEVRAVWMSGLPGELYRWPFDDLANEILPLGRSELEALRIRRGAKLPQGDGQRPITRLSASTLWEAVLTDLQRLRLHRWFGPLPAGHRDSWLFLGATAMSWLAPSPAVPREVISLARDAGGWSEREAKSRFASVLRRAESAARGHALQWNGLSVDPRYRLRAATMIEWLSVTPEEMREANLRVLVNADVKRERGVERMMAYRRRQGIPERAEYLAEARLRRARVAALRQQGLTWRAIAADLCISVGEAHRLGSQVEIPPATPPYTVTDPEHAVPPWFH